MFFFCSERLQSAINAQTPMPHEETVSADDFDYDYDPDDYDEWDEDEEDAISDLNTPEVFLSVTATDVEPAPWGGLPMFFGGGGCVGSGLVIQALSESPGQQMSTINLHTPPPFAQALPCLSTGTRLTVVFLTALLGFLLWALPCLSTGTHLTVVFLNFSVLAQGGGGHCGSLVQLSILTVHPCTTPKHVVDIVISLCLSRADCWLPQNIRRVCHIPITVWSL